MSGRTETKADRGKKGDAGSAVASDKAEDEESTAGRRICETCHEKPTISDSCPYCPSCMNRRGREGKKDKIAPTSSRARRTKEDPDRQPIKPPGQDLRVSIDFAKHTPVLKQVQTLADQEIRPLDLQIIYLLKCHFEGDKAP